MAEKKKKKKVPFVEAEATPMTAKEIGRVKRSGRLDLEKSRAKKEGKPAPILEGGRIVSGKEQKEREVKNIAQKGIDIERAKEGILEEEKISATTEEQPQEEENIDPVTGEPLLSGGVSSAEGLATDVALLAAGGGILKIGSKFLGKGVKKGAQGIIQRADVDALGKTLKLSQNQIAAVAKELGRQRISKIAASILDNPTFLKTGKVALNPKTLGLKTSYLTRMAKATSNPLAVLGLLGTGLYTSLFWAPNEKGDALVTLSIAQRTAAQIGDVELVNEIDVLMQETQDIAASIPVIGFLKAEIAKFKAAATSSKVYKAQVEKLEQNEI